MISSLKMYIYMIEQRINYRIKLNLCSLFNNEDIN